MEVYLIEWMEMEWSVWAGLGMRGLGVRSRKELELELE
jgi:hypothetical protein